MANELVFNNELLQIFHKQWKQEELTVAEDHLLKQWLSASPYHEQALQQVTNEDWLASNLAGFAAKDPERIWQLVQTNLKQNISARRIHFLKTTWFRYAAAIIVMLGIGGYLWFNNTTSNPINHTNPTHPNSDIAAGSNKATLRLADGNIIILENKDNGKTVTELSRIATGAGVLGENSAASKMRPSAQPTRANEANAFNSITTPKGGQYRLVLPDGSKVWLNAASSITYPTAFSGNERTVSITGEAYFEVSQNAHKPFSVKTYKDKIMVLGTSFNINSYTDEPGVKTTLLEGSVKIGNKILKPSEAYINGEIVPTNSQQDLAWKNGWFSFNQADLPTVMRQLSRWYNVEVEYAGAIPDRKFNGEIGRQLTLTQVLNGLTATSIKYKIENGNKIIILP